MTQNQTHLTVDDILSIGRRALDKTHGTEAQHIYIAREVERRLLASGAASTLAQPSSVPAGWKLVPVEPTDDMLANVDEEVGGHCHSCTKWNASWSDCRRVYAAMLAAAPQAPQPAQAKSRQQEIINSIKSALIRHEAATDAVVATAAGDDPHAATLAGIELEKAAALLATWTQPEYLRVMLDAAPAAPQPAQADAHFDADGFRAWVLANLPDDTVIGNGAWWANHLTGWAGRFVKTAPAPQPEAQPPLTDAARERIGQWLASDMAIAVRNGANSVSMPDELVEIAAWLCAAPSAQAEPQKPSLMCPKCGVDRLKASCPKGHSAALTGVCPMVAKAQAEQGGKPEPKCTPTLTVCRRCESGLDRYPECQMRAEQGGK